MTWLPCPKMKGLISSKVPNPIQTKRKSRDQISKGKFSKRVKQNRFIDFAFSTTFKNGQF
jgi:hypothetical protein